MQPWRQLKVPVYQHGETRRSAENSQGHERKDSMIKPSGPRSGLRIVIGGVIAALIVTGIMMLLAGPPDPEQGESLPNAPSLTE